MVKTGFELHHFAAVGSACVANALCRVNEISVEVDTGLSVSRLESPTHIMVLVIFLIARSKCNFLG